MGMGYIVMTLYLFIYLFYMWNLFNYTRVA